MAKKRSAIKVIPNGGYANASQITKMRHIQDMKTDTSWMDNLPGGSWKDPGVLKAYMKSKLNVE
jgi:hypothetical protein